MLSQNLLWAALELTSVSDLFIHVNPILNGWLQSFLFTVLNEKLPLLSRQPLVFISPPNWAAEWGEFNLYEYGLHSVKPQLIEGGFRGTVHPSHFTMPFLIIHPPHLKEEALVEMIMGLLFNATVNFTPKISHIPTCLHESTWKCLLQTSAQMHQMSKENIIHRYFYWKEFHLWRKIDFNWRLVKELRPEML